MSAFGMTSGWWMPGLLWMAGFLVILLQVHLGRFSRLAVLMAMGSIVVATCLTLWSWPGQLAADAGGLRLDGFALFVQVFVLISVLASMLFSRHSREDCCCEVDGLILMSAAGLSLLAMAHDLIAMMAGFVTALLPLWGSGVLTRRKAGREAALKGLLLGALGAALLGFGAALLASRTGTTGLDGIRAYLAGLEWIGDQPVVVAAIALILSGMGVFVALVPFHMWFPDVVEGLPNASALMLTAGFVASGLAAAVRLLLVGLLPVGQSGPGYLSWIAVVHVLGLMALLFGHAMVLVQQRLKRMLAFLATGQVGLILVSLAAAGRLAGEGQVNLAPAIGGVLAFLAVHAINWCGLFLAVGAIGAGRSEPARIGHLQGLVHQHPWLAAAIGLALLCMSGMPLTAGFFTRLYLLQVMVEAGWLGTAVAAALSLGVVLVMSLGLVIAMAMQKRETDIPIRTSWTLTATAWLCSLTILLLGLLPGGVLELATLAASSLFS